MILEDSYHVATLDNDAPAIFAGSLEWSSRARHLRARPAATEDGRVPSEAAGGDAGTTGWTRPRSCRCSTSTRGWASTCWTCSPRPACRPTWSRPRTSSRTPARCRCPARRPTGSGSTATSAGQAREIVDAETPHGARPVPAARDDEPSHGLSDSEEERAWQAIVAGFDAPAVDPHRRSGPTRPDRPDFGDGGRPPGPAATGRATRSAADTARLVRRRRRPPVRARPGAGRPRSSTRGATWSPAAGGRRRDPRRGPADADALPSGEDLDKAADVQGQARGTRRRRRGRRGPLDRRPADPGQQRRGALRAAAAPAVPAPVPQHGARACCWS